MRAYCIDNAPLYIQQTAVSYVSTSSPSSLNRGTLRDSQNADA